ncbi:MAG TPA: ABC transporter permease [Candidatus Acidoferrum sp.]|nr:ABC transporter permease [Candidatus Acidoferrum sp.]
MFSDLLFRLRSLFRRGTVESEMENELRFHMEQQIEKYMRSGLPREEAARRAQLKLGGYEQAKEECREARGVNLADNLVRDVRYGFRALRSNAGFSLIAILTLALGIGANTAIFSVVYAALIRPLPYFQPNRLITLTELRPQEGQSTQANTKIWDTSYPDYLDWTRQSKSFQALAGFSGDGFTLHGAGEPELILAAQATVNFFSTLGVKPFLGRDFAAGEDIASGPKVVILSYGSWITRFGGDPHIIGRTIQLDQNSVNIIGVLPREFEFAPRGNAELWVPLHIEKDLVSRRSLRWMPVIGRLAPGVTQQQAQAELNSVGAGLAAAYPQENGAIQVVTIPLRERIVGQVQPLLLILFGAVGFVLLIACANVTNLFLVRTAGRRREFSIRSALGAGRSRLISQLLAESMMLAGAGGVLGLLLAEWGTRLLIAAIPRTLLDFTPFLRDAHANLAVLAFLAAAVIFTGLAFGLVPALQISHGRESEALKEETRVSAGGLRTRLRAALVVAEIAFSLVLLIGSGLMVKSLAALLDRNPGFDTQNLLTFSVNLPPTSYPKDPDAIRFDKEFTDRLRILPGIAGVTSSSVIPLSGGGNTIRFVIEGQPVATGHENECNIRDVSNNYFSVMKIPLRAGRRFDDAADSDASLKHVIVNEAWAKQYLHSQDPVGKRIKFTYSPTQPYREIVGVVGNTAESGLDGPDEPSLFVPFSQDTNSFIPYIVRASGNPANALNAIRDALHGLDPQLVLIQPLTMDQIIGQSPSVFLRRYPSYLIGSFAALALVLAMVGLYGLISYSIAQRTRELGIRIALGAQQFDVMRLVLGEGARLTLLGVILGLAAAVGLTQLMRSLLFGVSAVDPVTFFSVAALLAFVAIAACYIPARRAMRTNPASALRYE